MRTVLLAPYIERLRDQKTNTRRFLSKFGIKEQDLLNPEKLLSATTVYRILNEVADQLHDPYVGAHVGAQMARTNSGHLNFLNSGTTTLGEFLNKFMATAENYGKSANYQLETNGTNALLRMQRIFNSSVDPAQADATGIGLFVEVLSKFARESWDANQVIAIVCESSVIPVECLPETSIINGGRGGFSIRFPATWLYLSTNEKTIKIETPQELSETHNPIDPSLVELIKSTCRGNLANEDLADISKNAGMHPKKIQRDLKLQNTSFSKILDDQRREHALAKVGNSDASFSTIAAETGFQHTSNFSRAFKRWTGQTPVKYRKHVLENHRPNHD